MSNDKWKNPENEAIYVSEEIKMNKPSKTKVQELLALLSDERKSLIQIDND